MSTGEAVYTMPLEAPPGRGQVEPKLGLLYNSAQGNGVLGIGFSLAGVSSIMRCPQNLAMDGQIREVRFDAEDQLCLDGRRLVQVGETSESLEYRTNPDTFTKIVGHFPKGAKTKTPNNALYFEAFAPSGLVTEFGRGADTRPLARGGVPQAFLASKTHDRRGNAMTYAYCLSEAGEYTAEYALQEILYTGFEGEPAVEATRSVRFVYGTKDVDDIRLVYARGMALQNSLRLNEILMAGPGDALVRRYVFGYEQSPTSKRTRLVQVEMCGGDGACMPPTRFQYSTGELGFQKIPTQIPAPISKLASPMLLDLTGDGLNDLLIPDTNPALSTPQNPITEWRFAKNQGGFFADPAVVHTQTWSTVLNPEGPSDAAFIQPELGTAMDFNQDGRADIFVHDVYGSKVNELVLLAQADGTLKPFDTGFSRPFPLGFSPSPPALTGFGASVHLADLDADGASDRIQCLDHGDLPSDPPGEAVWSVHPWKPGQGFGIQGQRIDILAGFPCEIPFYSADFNADGQMDILVPSMINFDGIHSQKVYGETYALLSRRRDGSFEVTDTKLKLAPPGGRVLFADVNGDGLPDAVMSGFSDHALRVYRNTGPVFAAASTQGIKWDGIGEQDTYIRFAAVLDANGDGRQDVLIPVPVEVFPKAMGTLPVWVILEATGVYNGPAFRMVDAQIPFEAELGDAITAAAPWGPRVGDVNGDGALDVMLVLGGKFSIFQNRAADGDLLVGIANGLNAHTPDEPGFVPNVKIDYGHLSDPNVYQARSKPQNICDYPRHCAVGSRRVVRGFAQNDGEDGLRSFELKYWDGRFHRLGHGFLGFEKRLIRDVDTGAETYEWYDNISSFALNGREVFPFAGQAIRRWQAYPALPNQPNPDSTGFTLGDTTLTFAPSNEGHSYFVLATQRRERQGEGLLASNQSLEGFLAQADASGVFDRDSLMTVSDFDVFGNVLGVAFKTEGVDLSLEIERTYKNDTEQWHIGLLEREEACSTALGQKQCRVLARTHTDYGEVESESKDSVPSDSQTKLVTGYERDAFGNIIKVVQEDAYGKRRESITIYDSEGMFPIQQVNAAGHITDVLYDGRFGVIARQSDPNQLVTSWIYDSLGRLEIEERPDGTQTQIIRSRFHDKNGWRVNQRKLMTGGEDETVELDSLGRPVRLLWYGPDTEDQPGTPPRLMQVIEYNRLNGQVAQRSVPVHETAPASLFDSFEYDALGREIKHTAPWNAVTQTSYQGLEVEIVDPLQNVTVIHNDPLGRPASIVDAEQGVTKYRYGPFGFLYSVEDPGGALTRTTRDAYGRVWKLDDPDRGTIVQQHNGFGELVSSSDALGRKAVFLYDALGRLNKRIDQQGVDVQTTEWIFDTAAHGIGRLHKLKSPDGDMVYGYDALGRLEQTSLLPKGESDLLVSKLGYDADGRVRDIQYPSPNGAPPFAIIQSYDVHGYMTDVRDAASNTVYWRLSEVDQGGRIQKEVFGNGAITERQYFEDRERIKSIYTQSGGTVVQNLSYAYDQNLNLLMRKDALQPQFTTERFRYDGLSRLTCAYFSLNENPNAPCAQGFGYAPNGNLTFKSDIGVLSYGNPAHPHAVTNAGGGVFGYDAVGHQVARPGGVNIQYTPFDLPKAVVDGPNTVTFGYDGDQKRIRKTTPLEETVYLGDLYERVTQMGSAAIEHRYYVHSPERVAAIVTRGGANAGTRYVHVDHLGSIDVLTNEAGKVVERRSYDPFGQRRNEIWGQPPPASFGSKTNKGFTGHEADGELGLVNMKGRMYDPALGRFLTADPWISDLWSGQGLGGYAYVLNNPLSWVDPSGFVPEPPPILPIYEVHWMGADGVINIMMVYPPREGVPPISEAEGVGAGALAADVDTTGAPPQVVEAPFMASVPVGPFIAPGGPGAPVGLPGGPGVGPLNTPGPFRPDAFAPGSYMEPPPAKAPGAPTTPARAPGVSVGSVLGAAVFILTMGMTFSGDAPVRGFDEDGIPLNKLGMPYPRVVDPRTGKLIPFPQGELMRIPEAQRTEWNSHTRGQFIREWQARGYPRPASNWVKEPEIHHIKPLSRGGTNDFWNLVPLDPKVHDLFTGYWDNY